MKNVVFLRMMGIILVLAAIFGGIGIHCMNATKDEIGPSDEELASYYVLNDEYYQSKNVTNIETYCVDGNSDTAYIDYVGRDDEGNMVVIGSVMREYAMQLYSRGY